MNTVLEPETDAESTMQDLTGRAFFAALLLTGSTELAEAAVLRAIEAWDAGAESEDALFERALEAAALTQPADEAPSAESNGAGWRLPAELQAVLELAPDQRRSFVLRILLGLPKQICARILQLNPHQMNMQISAALPFLPQSRAFATNQ